MRELVLTVTAVTFTLTAPAFAGKREQQEVLERQAAYYASYVGPDYAMFSDIFSDDFVYQHPTGKTLDEAGFLALFGEGGLVVTKAPAPKSTVRDYGDTIVTYGQSDVEASVGGEPANGVIRFVNVWRKEGKKWVLAHRNSQFLQ